MELAFVILFLLVAIAVGIYVAVRPTRIHWLGIAIAALAAAFLIPHIID